MFSDYRWWIDYQNLKRTATFEESDTLHGPPKEQQVKIDVPKRTKLYVDQTLREKEQAESKNFIISNSECLDYVFFFLFLKICIEYFNKI